MRDVFVIGVVGAMKAASHRIVKEIEHNLKSCGVNVGAIYPSVNESSEYFRLLAEMNKSITSSGVYVLFTDTVPQEFDCDSKMELYSMFSNERACDAYLIPEWVDDSMKRELPAGVHEDAFNVFSFGSFDSMMTALKRISCPEFAGADDGVIVE